MERKIVLNVSKDSTVSSFLFYGSFFVILYTIFNGWFSSSQLNTVILSHKMSFVLYIFSFSLSVLFINLSRRLKQGALFFRFLGLTIPILLGSIRAYVGTDYRTYSRLYDIWKNVSFSQYVSENGFGDFLYFFLNKISSSISMVMFFSSFLMVVVFYLAINKLDFLSNKSMAFFLYLMFFYLQMFNIVRQGIALSFVFLAIVYLLEKKISKFIVFILIAGLFHSSAFLMVLSIFFTKLNWNGRKAETSIVILVMTILALSYTNLINVVTSIPVFSRFAHYEQTSVAISDNESFFVHLLIFIFIIVFGKQFIYEKNGFFFILLIIFGSIFSLTGFFNPFVKRFAIYFQIFEIIVLSQLSEIRQNKEEKILMNYIEFLIGIIFFIGVYGIFNIGQTLPYAFFW